MEAVLTWLGGGHWRELGERHERSTAAVAGVIVLVDAALGWLVATLAVAGSTSWPLWAILPLTLLFGALVGAVTRGVASGPARGASVIGRGAVAVLVGAVVGELAAVVLFSGSIDRRIDAQAARAADSTPAVTQASADLGRVRQARTALDDAVDQARIHQDQALVIARCEFHPTPGCPQTRITGVPGPGPETSTANQLLADSQREFDDAVAARDRQAPGLDSQIAGEEQKLVAARQAAIANADRGLGARWVAMNDHTLASAGALVLWAITIAFFVLMSLLPLILHWLRGETTHDRGAASRAQRDRAEVDADTAIAVKRAQVRAEIENMWADQQLASARLGVEAQNEIDRELHRRRVTEALDAPVQAALQREPLEDEVEDIYLPIEAEAKAASRAPELPSRKTASAPALTIPNVTKAAARWIRPLVPPIVARAIDTTTQPLRTARQVFEEVEEITFAFKRTHKVTVDSAAPAESGQQIDPVATESQGAPRRVESSRAAERASLAAPDRGPERLAGPDEVRGSDDLRELPPGS